MPFGIYDRIPDSTQLDAALPVWVLDHGDLKYRKNLRQNKGGQIDM